MVREEMFNLWPNNCFIVLVLLNEADKENSSLNVPFCEFAAGTASKTHSPCSQLLADQQKKKMFYDPNKRSNSFLNNLHVVSYTP